MTPACRRLQILGMMVQAANDKHVIPPPGDINLALMYKPQIAGPQIWTHFAQMGVECLTSLVTQVPVSLPNRRPRNPDFAHPVCRSLAEAFQDPRTVKVIEDVTGARLGGCCLRIEYAQDTDGFWLQPHTDLGVKKFTLLYYLSPHGEDDLGTDVYADADTWSHRAPFTPGDDGSRGVLEFRPNGR